FCRSLLNVAVRRCRAAEVARLLGEYVLVNPVVGTAYKHVQCSLIGIDSSCWPSRGATIAWDLAPAAPTIASQPVLVNLVVGGSATYEHVQAALIDGCSRSSGGEAITWDLAP